MKIISENDKLFQGKLLMVANDVPVTEHKQANAAFQNQIVAFINENGKTEALQMYKQKPNIRVEMFPPFGKLQFFKTLSIFCQNNIESIQSIRMRLFLFQNLYFRMFLVFLFQAF